MPTAPLLTLNNLSKSFAEYHAVNRVSLQVMPGEIYGFLGPNGAGKTTTIKMLAGLLLPSSGKIEIAGHDLQQHPQLCKQITGYIPDRPYLYEKLTGHEYLCFVASLYGKQEEPLQRAARYLDLFDLNDWQHHLIEGYSHGMRQKLIMTSIFMLEQPLVVVDEPMVGLDPKSAKIVKELFKTKAEQGMAIFLSTHSMEIAEELCDRIGILVKGELQAEGSMSELRQKALSGATRLEDIFLELTGAVELQQVILALRGDAKAKSTSRVAPQ